MLGWPFGARCVYGEGTSPRDLPWHSCWCISCCARCFSRRWKRPSPVTFWSAFLWFSRSPRSFSRSLPSRCSDGLQRGSVAFSPCQRQRGRSIQVLFLGGCRMNRNAVHLRKFLFHAVFQRRRHIVHLGDEKSASHRAMARGKNMVLHLPHAHVVTIHELVVF